LFLDEPVFALHQGKTYKAKVGSADLLFENKRTILNEMGVHRDLTQDRDTHERIFPTAGSPTRDVDGNLQ
jgi:hypothetical protein